MSDSLTAIISMPEKHQAQVEKLVRHCQELDGTNITVLPVSNAQDNEFIKGNSTNTFCKLQAQSLHLEALAMKGLPFIHLEPDSIPIKSGWAATITNEYRRLGKPFMLSSDSHPPGDLVGGIGVYSGDTHFMIPVQIEREGWDAWMLNHIKSMIAFTPLIQHKYGFYEGMNKVRDIVFPHDRELLRQDAVIFHRDVTQSLLRKNRPNHFLHSGCLGDAIAALASIRQLGGGHLVMTQMGNPRILRGERYESLLPLLKSQPYIQSVAWEEEPKDCEFDFTDFRKIHGASDNLAETQARWIGLKNLDLSPWLEAESSPYSRNRIIIARSGRYQNHTFPWLSLLTTNRNKLMFVGTKEEHSAFEANIGQRVEFKPCENLLELARLIKGSELFIGNQSCPFWIAAGLGVPIVQETYPRQPDSIIRRPNAHYIC